MPNVFLVDDRSVKASCPPIKVLQQEVTKAYFAEREEKVQYKTTLKDHTTAAGETLSKIAKKYGVSASDVKRTKTTKYLEVGEIVKVTKKEKTGSEVKFKKLAKAEVGADVYIIIETKNLREQKVKINILQGKEDVLAKKGKHVTVQQDDKDTTLIETTVGAYCDEAEITNKDDFADFAIAKIKLLPKAEAKQKEWTDGLDCVVANNASLYLLVDAHSENSLPNFKSEYVLYKGFTGATDNSHVPNHFLNEDGAWFIVEPRKVAPWMVFAEQEYATYKGINENTSPLKERIKDAYHKSTTLGAAHHGKPTEWSDAVSWCASFVNWCFEQTKNFKKTNISSNGSYNSLAFDWTPANWENGEKSEAFYGAVITLTYSHTAFIVGKNTKANKYVYLGGNQGGKNSGEQQIRYGTVTIGKEKSIAKPKGYVVTEEEKKLKEMSVNADGSYTSTR
jgi:hypothetical protein